jgi:O-antigen ligase
MLVVAGLIVLWLVEGIMRRTLSVQKHPTTLPLVIFLIITVVSFVGGQITWFPNVPPAPIRAQLGGLGLFFFAAGAFWLGAFRVRHLSWLHIMLWTFFGIGAIWVFGYLNLSTRSTVNFLFEKTSSGATGSVFWIWLIALASGQGLMNHQLNRWLRLALLVLVGCSLYMTLGLFRGWTSGWLPAVCGLGVVVWLSAPRLRPLIVVAVIGIVVARGVALIDSIQNEGDNAYSVLSRIAAFFTLWELIQYNPLLGFGPSNYYFYTPLFNILGYTNLNFNSHNNYVDLVAQTGFLGLGAFLWFAVVAGYYTLKVSQRVPNGFPRAFAVSAFGAWVGTLVSGAFGDWFLPFVYNLGFAGFRSSVLAWLFLGCVIALDRLTASRARAAVASSAFLARPLSG